jgi:hypothetical protein
MSHIRDENDDDDGDEEVKGKDMRIYNYELDTVGTRIKADISHSLV